MRAHLFLRCSFLRFWRKFTWQQQHVPSASKPKRLPSATPPVAPSTWEGSLRSLRAAQLQNLVVAGVVSSQAGPRQVTARCCSPQNPVHADQLPACQPQSGGCGSPARHGPAVRSGTRAWQCASGNWMLKSSSEAHRTERLISPGKVLKHTGDGLPPQAPQGPATSLARTVLTEGLASRTRKGPAATSPLSTFSSASKASGACRTSESFSAMLSAALSMAGPCPRGTTTSKATWTACSMRSEAKLRPKPPPLSPPPSPGAAAATRRVAATPALVCPGKEATKVRSTSTRFTWLLFTPKVSTSAPDTASSKLGEESFTPMSTNVDSTTAV